MSQLPSEALNLIHLERDALVRECQNLILEIAYHRPYYLRQLFRVRHALEIYRGYKDPKFERLAPAELTQDTIDAITKA